MAAYYQVDDDIMKKKFIMLQSLLLRSVIALSDYFYGNDLYGFESTEEDHPY